MGEGNQTRRRWEGSSGRQVSWRHSIIGKRAEQRPLTLLSLLSHLSPDDGKDMNPFYGLYFIYKRSIQGHSAIPTMERNRLQQEKTKAKVFFTSLGCSKVSHAS